MDSIDLDNQLDEATIDSLLEEEEYSAALDSAAADANTAQTDEADAEAESAISADETDANYGYLYTRPVYSRYRPVVYIPPPVVSAPVYTSLTPVVTPSGAVYYEPTPSGMSYKTRVIIIVCSVIGGLFFFSLLFWCLCCRMASPVYVTETYTVTGY